MDHAIESAVKIVVVFAGLLGGVAYLVLAERKISAYIQNRLGPNRVGPWGCFSRSPTASSSCSKKM